MKKVRFQDDFLGQIDFSKNSDPAKKM